ncbi:hypothetical protein FisN_8Lh327 [Fistulifera solaris]|uniref:VPS9 domain-containing protein n=1 Tax=Fistulifera solaris TaxID=1519565 RepID=A0A1Z5JN33_FISSO|nr:hypothetical protein FisN_8Lh327 [Fistulifera solaris]|eukprot:GAX15379.1 hypothetical protein FisN_8Lh327 [Fistulifera solaris]
MKSEQQRKVKNKTDEKRRPDDEESSSSSAMASTTTLPTDPWITALPNRTKTFSTDTADGLEALHEFGGESSTLVLSSARSQPTPSVTPPRKEVLLLAARRDRLQWIQEAPLPYRKERNQKDPWEQNDVLFLLKQCHAVSQVPTAIAALEQLYNIANGGESVVTIAQRIQSLVTKEDQTLALPSGFEVLAQELVAKEDDAVVMAYHNFLTHLQDPSCAMLVQGIRRFCRTIQDTKDSASLAKQLTSFVDTTYNSIQSHIAWKGEDLKQSQVRRSLESCIYAHCFAHTGSVMWNAEAQKADDMFLMKLESLQFITPQNLEIACLEDIASATSDLADFLKGPVEALRAIDLYYSPYEKLDRVLTMYRGVNGALSRALNYHKSSHDGSTPLKLPSADDVLPTMILAILQAKPKRLLLNLTVMEEWSPPEYIRGEAGYAYTNLYGAVQFLKDIDLEKEPKSLQIGSDELRMGIESCREAVKQKLEVNDAVSVDPVSSVSPPVPPRLTPNEVRNARQNGETIDLEWALQVIGQRNSNAAVRSSIGSKSRSAFDEATEGLPSNFSRKYSFLTACPDGIKVSDISMLLEEYRVLVQTVERLIGARAAGIKAARKATAVAAEMDLLARIREVDPILLPGTDKQRNESF